MGEPELTRSQIAKARKCGLLLQSMEPRAIAARYERGVDEIILELRSGVSVQIPRKVIPELARSGWRELAEVTLTSTGDALHWETLDIDIHIPGLLGDILGVSSSAAALGKRGGSVTSVQKTASARANGSLGGRPRKTGQKN